MGAHQCTTLFTRSNPRMSRGTGGAKRASARWRGAGGRPDLVQIPLPARPGQQAAGLVQVDRAAGCQAGGEPVRLLSVAQPPGGGGGSVRADLARDVQGAAPAVVVGGVVDADDLAVGRAD